MMNHVKRDANKVAHCMVKFALSQKLDKTWIEVCLSSIQHLVIAESKEVF
jgi:hypothetical protein